MHRTELFSLQFLDENLSDVFQHTIKFSSSGYLVTPNVQHLVELYKNPRYMSCYASADFIICDSRIVRLASKFVGPSLKNVVAGSDFTKFFFDNYEGNDLIMVVGPSELDILFLKSKYPTLSIEGYEPPMGFINSEEEVKKLMSKIGELRPKYIFLALGFPRQEIMACKIKQEMSHNSLSFCIGASIDFITGKQARAPSWIQMLHMEWFYRFLTNPKRLFKRYFIDGWKFFEILFNERKKSKNKEGVL